MTLNLTRGSAGTSDMVRTGIPLGSMRPARDRTLAPPGSRGGSGKRDIIKSLGTMRNIFGVLGQKMVLAY
jgi:hypothetical protein